MPRASSPEWYWILAGVLVGLATWMIVGSLGFVTLRTTWADYAAAEPTKAYSLLMLCSRLTVGVICTITAGAVAAIVGKGSRLASWWLGALVLALSAPVHFGSVWADYPAWYHFAYLIPLVPLAGAGGSLVTAFAPMRSTQAGLAASHPK